VSAPSPAGWYPDPFGRHERRHWDGTRWTEHVASRGSQTIDPPGDVAAVSAATSQTSAAWHPDPFRRFHYRYWDGARWTDHVASSGLQSIDPPVTGAPAGATQPTQAPTPSVPAASQPSPAARAPLPGNSRATNKIQKQVQKAGLADATRNPDRAVFKEPVLVINQKGKLVELRAEYAIYNQNGLQLAAVRGKRMSTRIQVVDMNGRSLLDLTRGASLLTSKINVADANGAKIGRILPSLSWNQIDRDFKLEGADNEPIGAIYAEDRQRHREFNVQDATNNVVAHIRKTRAGLAKEMFTKGDNYVVNLPDALSDPLRSLSIAAALVIDTAFHQGQTARRRL
jgi:uncharacterized protein YxjI